MLDELFDEKPARDKDRFDDAPLATKMRPKSLSEVIGQRHLLDPERPLRRLIERDEIRSLVFFGPPGTGKTTLARLIAQKTQARFVEVQAAHTLLAELKRIRDDALRARRQAKKTLLFADEFHRFNQGLQDFFVPDIESGNLTLIAATVHNPLFAVHKAIVSRSMLCELKPLTPDEIQTVLENALKNHERGLGECHLELEKSAAKEIVALSAGDARKALTLLEWAALALPPQNKNEKQFISLEIIRRLQTVQSLGYDRKGDAHYDTISAFIKSMRGGNADSALHWLAVMLEGGEDPLFILRRMIIFASEDVGNADPRALLMAVSALRAFECVGLPEGRITLSQLTLYLSLTKKDRSAYEKINQAMVDLKSEGPRAIPDSLKNYPIHGAE